MPEKARRAKRAGQGWSILVGSNGNRNRIGNAVYQPVDTGFLFASFLIAAKPKPDSGILPPFFFRWLQAYEVQSRISASAEGSTGLSNLAHDFFRAMEIAHPGEAGQARIIRILDAVDAAIDRTRAALDRASRLRTAVVQSAFAGLERAGDHVPDGLEARLVRIRG